MKLILDTQSWLWWYHDPERLSPEAQRLIGNRDNVILFSAASAWEIVIKHSLGKLMLPFPPKEWIPATLAEDRFTSLPIELVHALEAGSLPDHHRDPFDRMIIAQALVENAPILTSDSQFRPYPVQLISATA